MVQGTSSHAGKSVIATALCRIFAQDGYQVAPFKAQNMSLNSYATPDGGEIGRSQAVQAAAALVAPRVEMNPVLLKPEGDRRSQVVLMGRPRAVASAREYHELKPRIWTRITSSLEQLRAEFDVVVIEGAGSPAEVNLKDHDIVNMRVALHANAPVLLVGDIDRGGIFAQLVGTMVLLELEERSLVCGLVINKFRGDPSLLTSGLDFLHERTGVPVAGVVPFFNDIHIPEEDSVGLGADAESESDDAIDVAVMRLPHIANFDDFDPLRHEAGVRVRYVGRASEFGDPDLVVIPGSKTTVADLDWLRAQGLDAQIMAARRQVERRSSGFAPAIRSWVMNCWIRTAWNRRPGSRADSVCCPRLRPFGETRPRTRFGDGWRATRVCSASVMAPRSWPTRFTWGKPRVPTRRAHLSFTPARRGRSSCRTVPSTPKGSPWAPTCTVSSITETCAARSWPVPGPGTVSARCRPGTTSIQARSTTSWHRWCGGTWIWIWSIARWD